MVIATQMVIGDHMFMATRTEDLIPEDYRREMRPEAIGQRLRLLREAFDKKPAEMADLLDIERTYWSRFEDGKRKLSDDVAVLLVSRFNVTLDFLMLGRWDKLPFDVAEKLRAAAASSPK